MPVHGRGTVSLAAIALTAVALTGAPLVANLQAPPANPPAAPRTYELSGLVELLEKGKPSGDRSLEPRHTVVVFEPAKKGPAPKPVSAEMSTLKKEFNPRLLVVPVGSTVRFPNLDPILHNAFSISGANSFDLGLLGKGAGRTATFKEPGIVRVFCNVHHAMFAYVYVVATPHWTTVGADGRFRLGGLPPGPGKLTVWNERSAPAVSAQTLPAAAPLKLGVEITMPRIPPHKNKLGKSYGGNRYG
jgi:plastocyanin